MEPADGRASTSFLTPLDLTAGDNRWSFEPATGTLAGTKGDRELPRGEFFLYVWQGADGLLGIAPIKPDANGHFEVFAIAGPGRVVHLDRDARMQMATAAIPDPWSWPLITEFDVKAGETLEVELP
jgi:hypothetical protein